MPSFDVFDSTLWDPVAERFERLEDALRHECRQVVPGTRSLPERFSGGKMAFEVWIELAPPTPAAAPTWVGVTFWQSGGAVRPEVELFHGSDLLDEVEFPEVVLDGTRDGFAGRLARTVDAVVDWIWIRRGALVESVARAARDAPR